MSYDILEGSAFTIRCPVWALAVRRPGEPCPAVFDPDGPAFVTPFLAPRQGMFLPLFTGEALASYAAGAVANLGSPGRYPTRVETPAHLSFLLEYFRMDGVAYVGLDCDFATGRDAGTLRPIEDVIAVGRIPE